MSNTHKRIKNKVKKMSKGLKNYKHSNIDTKSKLSLLRSAQEEIDAIKVQHGEISGLDRFLPEHLSQLLRDSNGL
ncbi:hypothetical protein SCG7086_BG_00030 [Chlamydiales bacterium SCGC AG-110-P3]|nr:hypothetical protein SCG7086_BG_00030 [Chlamydiales bacterium SCGC AG-110-P3]